MAADPVALIRTAVPGAEWPPVPGHDGAQTLALQFQLDLTQWYAPERLTELQFRQLDILARHAFATVPYYRQRWQGIYEPRSALTPELFRRLPVLGRGVLQQQFDALRSAAPLPAHGDVAETRTSGSTGAPVRVLRTSLSQLVWQGVMLREQLWHGRDLGGKIAVIRRNVAAAEVAGWGDVIASLTTAGRAVLLSVGTETAAQLTWLEAQQPDYLLTYPSNVGELTRLALARGTRLHRLREILTIGEVVTPELRALCRQVWNVPVADAYSAEEVGYMALQCPDHEHYHVQSEAVLVEVLDRSGRACAPGETGLVVVTPLHAFAMPLVRYVVGDYATAGLPCPCGRGLPVLARIMGRTRGTLVLRNGERYWPFFGSRGLAELAPIRQHQFVQKSYEVIEARLVTSRALTADEEAAVARHVQSRLPAPFEIRFAYVRDIPRAHGSKFEDFVSEVAEAMPH